MTGFRRSVVAAPGVGDRSHSPRERAGNHTGGPAGRRWLRLLAVLLLAVGAAAGCASDSPDMADQVEPVLEQVAGCAERLNRTEQQWAATLTATEPDSTGLLGAAADATLFHTDARCVLTGLSDLLATVGQSSRCAVRHHTATDLAADVQQALARWDGEPAAVAAALVEHSAAAGALAGATGIEGTGPAAADQPELERTLTGFSLPAADLRWLATQRVLPSAPGHPFWGDGPDSWVWAGTQDDNQHRTWGAADDSQPVVAYCLNLPR